MLFVFRDNDRVCYHFIHHGFKTVIPQIPKRQLVKTCSKIINMNLKAIDFDLSEALRDYRPILSST